MKRKRDGDDDGDGDGDQPLSPDLYCHESPDFLFDEEKVEQKVLGYLNNYYDESALVEEHLQNLIDREIIFGFKKDENVVIANWVQDSRLGVISWILRRKAALGLQTETAYMGMTYFDRVISLKAITVNNGKEAVIRLFSVACLSLAAKMESSKSPSLLEYEVEDYFFEAKWIRRMELMVLGALGWKLNIITPFAYLDYFFSKFCQESPSNVESSIERLLLSIMTETNLMHHRPSAVAAAATLVAMDKKLTKEALEAKIKSIPDLDFLEIEGVFLCYNIMQEKELKMMNP